MKKLLILSLTSLAAFSITESVYAQSEEDKKEKELQTIYITPTQSEKTEIVTPISLSVITQDEILSSGANSLTEVLRTQIGLTIRDNIGDGSRAFVSMRGFGANSVNNVLIVIDGRKLNNPSLEAPLLSSISLKDIERIEVIQGSGAVLYGEQAVGGVINIVTQKPGKHEYRAEVTRGSHDLEVYKVSAAHQFDFGLNYRLSGEAKQTDNYRDSNEAEYDNLYGKLEYEGSWGSIFYEIFSIEDKLNTPGFLTNAQIVDDPTQAGFTGSFDNEIIIEQIGSNLYLGQHLILELNSSGRDTNGDIGDNFQDTRVKILSGRLLGEWFNEKGEITLTTGYEKIESDFQKDGFSPRNYEGEQESIYAQLSYPLLKNVNGVIGYRYTEIDEQDFARNESNVGDSDAVEIGVNYKVGGGRVFIRRAESFRFGNADENASTATGVTFLDVQEAISYEFGYEYANSSSRFNVVAYDMDISNEIYFDNNVGGSFCCNINLDESNRRGILIELDQKISKDTIVGAGYNYIRSRYTSGSFNGNDVPNVPDDSATAYISHKLGHGFSAYFDAIYTGSRHPASDDANVSERLGGYTLTNLAINWKKSDLDVGFRINNLGDKEYSAFLFSSGGYPSPERIVELTLGYDF